MKKLLILLCCSIISVGIGAKSIDYKKIDNFEIKYDNRLEIWNEEPTGVGRSNSYLIDGSNYLNEMLINGSSAMENNKQNFLLKIRSTDYDRIDPKSTSIEKFYFRKSTEKYSFTIGDIFGNLGEYTFSQSLKGISIEMPVNEKYNLSFVSGINKNNWEYLWSHNPAETKNSYMSGIAISSDNNEKLNYSLQMVYTDENDLTAAKTTDASINRMIGLKWDYKLDGISLKAEHALSSDHAKNSGNSSGSAHKVNVRTKIKKHRINLLYETVDPDFITKSGAASTDRERYKFKDSFYLNNLTNVSLNYTFYFDNLDNQKTATTRVSIPEIRINKRKFLNKRSRTLKLGLRNDDRTASDDSYKKITNTYIIGISDKIKRINTNLEYRRRSVDDKTSSNNDETQNIYNISASSYMKYKGFKIRPRAYAQLDVSKDKKTGERDDNYNYSIGINADKDAFAYNLSLNRNYANNMQQPDSRRDSVRAGVTYEPRNKNYTYELNYDYKDNQYTDTTKNYKEKIAKFIYNTKF